MGPGARRLRTQQVLTGRQPGAGTCTPWGGGWAATYFFTTDPALEAESARALLDRIAEDPRLFAVAIPGGLLVARGTVLQAVGLLRARTVTRWVPVLSLAIVVSFLVPGNGILGSLFGLPVAAAGIALGYCAWRRAGTPTP